MSSRPLSIFGLVAVLAATNLCAVPTKKPKAAKDAADSSVVPYERGLPSNQRTTAKDFAPMRTVPVKRGEFQVDLVIIAFPDCVMPGSAEEVRAALSTCKGTKTIADYYKEYSQDITWPILNAYPSIYMAPHPSGYYCRKGDGYANLIGYEEDGGKRADKLRSDALRFVQSKGHLKKKGDFICYVFCNELNQDFEILEGLLRESYPPKPTPLELQCGIRDPLTFYKPRICWGDPLWPCSIPQVTYPADGGVIIHELGHVLGAPDYYHVPEEHDGVEGAPSLPWAYGPTGPAYCRVIYQAFVPTDAYPKVSTPGEYVLGPRSARFPFKNNEGIPPLGLFVPSAHPNYLFYLEYCHKENDLVGNPSAEGLLVHVINVTMTSPGLGPPDLCYTYRSDDPDHKAVGDGSAYLNPGDTFNAASDPAAILPNLLPAGIEISNIRCNEDGTCTFKLDFPPTKLTRAELDFSLLPQTELIELSDPLPTSFRAKLNVRYRGEPLLTEYGFCYGLRKGPTEKTGKLFPLHHRDRYDARIIDLKPGVMYYVRAYARNANGIRYSSNQKEIILPPNSPNRSFAATLFGPSDNLLANDHYHQTCGNYTENVISSANPIYAFMALANYYRTLPGTLSKQKSKAKAIDINYVHSNPATSRPKFRMVETDKLYNAVMYMLADAGLTQSDFIMEDPDKKKHKMEDPDKKKNKKNHSTIASTSKSGKFGELTKWVKKCATVLGVKKPESVFFPCKTTEDINKLAPEIRRWILMSQPVLVVRENKQMSDDVSVRWPLDIAIIDGLGSDPLSFHVVFPGGNDRGTRGNGEMQLEEILHRTTKSVVMFYRPGVSK